MPKSFTNFLFLLLKLDHTMIQCVIYIPSLVIFIFNQKKLMRYVNMRYANMNINIYILYIIVVEHK